MPADPTLKEQVEKAIADNGILLFMKGTPEAPRCGFSMRTVGILEQMGVEYGAVDVLPMLQPLREVTAEIAQWETFPQLYVKGELLGGCDIIEEMLDAGELAEALGADPDKISAPAEALSRRRRRRGFGRHALPEPADADRDLKVRSR